MLHHPPSTFTAPLPLSAAAPGRRPGSDDRLIILCQRAREALAADTAAMARVEALLAIHGHLIPAHPVRPHNRSLDELPADELRRQIAKATERGGSAKQLAALRARLQAMKTYMRELRRVVGETGLGKAQKVAEAAARRSLATLKAVAEVASVGPAGVRAKMELVEAWHAAIRGADGDAAGLLASMQRDLAATEAKELRAIATPSPSPAVAAAAPTRASGFPASDFIAAACGTGAVLRPIRLKPGSPDLVDMTFVVEAAPDPAALAAVQERFAAARAADPLADGKISEELSYAVAEARFVATTGGTFAASLLELDRLDQAASAANRRADGALIICGQDGADPAYLEIAKASDAATEAFTAGLLYLLAKPLRSPADAGCKTTLALRPYVCVLEKDRALAEVAAFLAPGLAGTAPGGPTLTA